MIKHWICSLSPKRTVIYFIIIALSIFVVWYVVEALEGLDPNYRPSKEQRPEGGGGKESFGSFDPTKQTPEPEPAKSMSRGE